MKAATGLATCMLLMMWASMALAEETPAFSDRFYTDQELETRFREKFAYVRQDLVWPLNRVIGVCWENATDGNKAMRLLVRDAVKNTWEKAANIRFGDWGSCSATAKGIRILIDDSGPHVKHLGKAIGGVRDGMVLNFTYANWSSEHCATRQEECTYKIAVHEFGHALSFAHEQNRPDTPATCTEPAQGGDGNRMIGGWDRASVMNYCNENWNGDGRLSRVDVLAAVRLYGTR